MMKMILAAAAATVSLPASAMQTQPAAQAPAQAQGQQQSDGPATGRTLRGQLMLFQMPNYAGDSWLVDTANRRVTTEWPIRSLTVHPGDRWQVCARTSFRDCIIVDRSVPDASAIGITNQIGSARPAPPDAR